MIKYIVVLLFTVSAGTVQAKIDGDEVAAGIIGFILGKIHEKNKDKKKDDFVWDTNENVILKDMGRELVLGSVVLRPQGGADAVRFPKCDVSKNRPVRALRFRVDRADAYLRAVQITYQNGQSESVRVDDVFNKNQSSNWFNVDGGRRCIKQIRVVGEALNNKWSGSYGSRYSVLTFIGYKANAGGSF